MQYLKNLKCSAAAIGALALAVPASAQLAVIDSSNLAKAIETARNTLKQIEEAQRLYDSANRITDVGTIADVLNSDAIQRGLPSDIQGAVQLSTADLSELGSIGQKAEGILIERGLSADGSSGQEEATQILAARNQAIAESQLDVADQTAAGLKELKARLKTANTAKETADLQARGILEVAQLQNQTNQLLALEAAQRAERELVAAQRWKKINDGNAKALQDKKLRPTWSHQQ